MTFRDRSLCGQIRAEMTYHNIRLYPFDTEENDDEEIQLNESIRVRLFALASFHLHSQTCGPAEHDSLRRRWLGAHRHHRRQARPRPQEPLGRDQRRGRATLRVRLSSQLLAQVDFRYK